jgi:septal ring factor EnvC (AmiA/AmiB activator)
MDTFRGLLKKVPWWGWVVIGISILFLANYASSRALNRSLFNMALDQLREDKTAIVENLKKDQKEKAKDIADLQGKVKDVQRKRAAAEAESKRLARLVNEKDTEIGRLKKERDAIVIPTDPNVLADEFRKRGYRPRVILPSP